MGEAGTGAVERAPDAAGIIDTDIRVDAHRRVEAAQRLLEARRVTMGLTLSIVQPCGRIRIGRLLHTHDCSND